MPSLSDVARVAGVSLTTASMVLNKGKDENRVSEACANRVREAATRLGYVPNYHARSMKLGRAEVLAVAMDIGEPTFSKLPNVSELSNSYFSQLLGGIELHTRNLGYQLMLVGPDSSHRAPERGLLGLRQRRFDGLILLGAGTDTGDDFMQKAPESPIVAIEYRGNTQVPVIDFNEQAAVVMAVKHLTELGHKNLLWVGPSAGESQIHRREKLFLETAKEAGVPATSCRFEFNRSNRYQNDFVDYSLVALSELLAGGKHAFTGIVCYSDQVGIGVCDALQRAGIRVPEEVSVIGMDDTEAGLCIPRLTSVSHQHAKMGQRAAELALEMSSDPFAVYRLRGSRHVIEPQLTVRRSTATAKA